MRILLDTCEFLWLVAGDARLSPQFASAVRDPQNVCQAKAHGLTLASSDALIRKYAVTLL
jgi:PIN domain nuclease of toxin-antitoxin system